MHTHADRRHALTDKRPLWIVMIQMSSTSDYRVPRQRGYKVVLWWYLVMDSKSGTLDTKPKWLCCFLNDEAIMIRLQQRPSVLPLRYSLTSADTHSAHNAVRIISADHGTWPSCPTDARGTRCTGTSRGPFSTGASALPL